jgi:hypothetical protein
MPLAQLMIGSSRYKTVVQTGTESDLDCWVRFQFLPVFEDVRVDGLRVKICCIAESYWAGNPTETCPMDDAVTLKVAEGLYSPPGKAKGSINVLLFPPRSQFLKRSSRRRGSTCREASAPDTAQRQCALARFSPIKADHKGRTMLKMAPPSGAQVNLVAPVQFSFGASHNSIRFPSGSMIQANRP